MCFFSSSTIAPIYLDGMCELQRGSARHAVTGKKMQCYLYCSAKDVALRRAFSEEFTDVQEIANDILNLHAN